VDESVYSALQQNIIFPTRTTTKPFKSQSSWVTQHIIFSKKIKSLVGTDKKGSPVHIVPAFGLRRVWGMVRPFWVLCRQPFLAFLQEAVSRTWTHDLMSQDNSFPAASGLPFLLEQIC
jgi:hypothetical protein